MLRCLVAAGSNALRRAAMRPRGDGARLGSSSNRTRTLAIEYLTGLMYDRALSRYRVVKLDASALDPAREIDELRALSRYRVVKLDASALDPAREID